MVHIAALIIGRGNNTLADKNIRLVHGRPLLHWPALAARHSMHINRFYISSDDPKILAAGEVVGFTPIKRPDELATPTAQSSDAVHHALGIIEKDGAVDVLIVMHANVGTITTQMIDDCLGVLLEDEQVSSVVPAHYNNEYHPYRAKMINAMGFLENVVNYQSRRVSANRQDLDACVFFDHSFWVLRVKNGVRAVNGQSPWPVMGNNIKPYITTGCFDVHTEEDLKATEMWISDNRVLEQYAASTVLSSGAGLS